MKKAISSIFTLLLSIALIAGGTKAEKYQVNKKMSSLEWIGKKVTGSHEGTIGVKDGFISVENGKVTSGELTIDMTSIVVTDLKNEKYNQKLTGHLNSDDFFGVSEHPTATMKVNKVEHKGGDDYILHGDLTIKGHTEKIEVPATILSKGDNISIVGETMIDRTEFDIKYNSGSFFDGLGDKAINDEFQVKFKVAASK